MLARKGIFVKPSILQFVRQHDRATPKDLQSKAYCRYYTAFAFYEDKMCGRAASKRPDACRMMIQCSQKRTRLAFGRRKTPPFIRTY